MFKVISRLSQLRLSSAIKIIFFNTRHIYEWEIVVGAGVLYLLGLKYLDLISSS